MFRAEAAHDCPEDKYRAGAVSLSGCRKTTISRVSVGCADMASSRNSWRSSGSIVPTAPSNSKRGNDGLQLVLVVESTCGALNTVERDQAVPGVEHDV